MVPSCVSIKFHYTKWQSEAVHSFIHSLYHFSIVYPQATIDSIVHSFTVHSTNYLSLWLTTSETMFFLIFYLFSKWTVSLDWFNIFLWCHNCLTLLEMFSSHEQKTACTSVSPPKCHTQTHKMKPRNKTVTLPMNNTKTQHMNHNCLKGTATQTLLFLTKLWSEWLYT